MTAKCPKCEALVASLKVKTMPLKMGQRTWNGVVLTCPYCYSIVSASFDPLALMADTVTGVTKALKR